MANRSLTKDVSDNVIAGAVIANFYMNKRDRFIENHADHDKVTFKGSNEIPLKIGDKWYFCDTDVNISTATDMDTGTVANGEDYNVYACDDSGTLAFKISLNNTFPSGFTTDTSRKIGGFHTLCTNVGTIAGHPLTDYAANDILPASIWDLKHRPISEPAGMVFDEGSNIWVDIYLASGTGASCASANGATITDTRNWMDFIDDGHAVKKQLLTDDQFQSIAMGSNEETNIAGSADPVTTGGHSDTAGRRMISNIGCEDCAGAMYQWLLTSAARLDDETAGGWYDLTGDKGSFYTYGTNKYGNTQLRAGGTWADGAACGSRCRFAVHYRWFTYSSIAVRLGSAPQ
ncbi:MAG: hypothetical protein U9Q87_06790 [Pseudomonadota bacterium]|nr:hypothetical protein [Pseudomonadota bacterium]